MFSMDDILSLFLIWSILWVLMVEVFLICVMLFGVGDFDFWGIWGWVDCGEVDLD